MTDRVGLGILAILVGIAAAAVLFVPFVAVSYRRHGRLSVARAVLWGSGLVYFWALWAYTLLPLPDPGAIVCVGTNGDLFAFVDDVRDALAAGGSFVTRPAVLQLLLNVLLFVPLGFFVRVLGGRGVVVAGLVGLAVSAFVETTQLTGVWGLYPCAYRVFDVDDLLTNTTGAVIGSVLGLLVPARLRGSERMPGADLPRPVTRRRRLLAMVCDLVGAWLTALAVGVVMQAALLALGAREEVEDGSASALVGDVVTIVVWLVVVLATGRTVGDLAVRLRFEGGPLPVALARVLRLVGGIGGYLVLSALPGAWGLAAAVFAVASLALVLTTDDRRGLPGLVSGQRLFDARVRELLENG
ncbi:VanZ family protein [Microbacterium sp. BWT-B31]|uniref:VanZ family protein n=1 Tax=Microbacterium sp. BWT-B31 TaxID=3232072 RepID=UPI003529101C